MENKNQNKDQNTNQKKSLIVILLAAILLIALLVGLGFILNIGKDSNDNHDVINQSGESSGIVYLSWNGELVLLTELNGSAEAIRLSRNGGNVESGVFFTNAPADDALMASAVFSKDGQTLYYLTDTHDGMGTLYCAEVNHLKAGSDRNEDFLKKLSTDVFGKLVVRDDGAVYSKNGGVYFYDGSSVDQLIQNAKKSWLTNNGSGIIFWTSDNKLVYVAFGKDPVEWMDSVSAVWYDGGETLYCRVEDFSGGDSAGADSGWSGSDDNGDREATDKSSSGYDNKYIDIYQLALDGKSELVLEELFSVEGTADGKLYYTLRYEDYIRLSNLIENVESLDQGLLYDLDHAYICDYRYELWCYDGKEHTLICSDYFTDADDYDHGDYYEDPEEYLEEMLYQSDDFVSVEFLKSYWNQLGELCRDYRINSVEELSERLVTAASGYSDEYDLVEDYVRLLVKLTKRNHYTGGFYADENIVVFTRAIKNEVTPISPAAADADTVEARYWVQRCGVNPYLRQTSFTLSNGKSGTIDGVNAEDFFGMLNGSEALVFFEEKDDVLSVYAVGTGECILRVEDASCVTISANRLYYYEGSDLISYDGSKAVVLAKDVYAADYATWVYADGITLALSNVTDGKGTLRLYEDGKDEWIADDVSYYQRITDKEIIYISDGDLYCYTIGKDSVQLAAGVAAAYGAYYAGTLIGYSSTR